MASENVQIDYFMTGPFGGTGMYTRPEKNKTSYEIDASAEGRPARNVKVIARLPGCEIVTLDIPIESEKSERQLSCTPLSSVDFKGQVFPIDMINASVDIDVSYLGFWSHRFFGIYDGPVVQFQIGKISPDAEGAFQIKLPDFASQEGMSDAAFDFILRDKSTGNLIAFLTPMDDARKAHHLKVAREYPEVVRFAAEQQH